MGDFPDARFYEPAQRSVEVISNSGVREQEVDTAARRVALHMLRLFSVGSFPPFVCEC